MSIYKPEDQWGKVRRAKNLPALKRYLGFQLWLKATVKELGSHDLLDEWEKLFMKRKTYDDPLHEFCLKVDRAFRAKEILEHKQDEGEE